MKKVFRGEDCLRKPPPGVSTNLYVRAAGILSAGHLATSVAIGALCTITTGDDLQILLQQLVIVDHLGQHSEPSVADGEAGRDGVTRPSLDVTRRSPGTAVLTVSTANSLTRKDIN